jgi:Ca2+-binding EF-hand superfamily protein
VKSVFVIFLIVAAILVLAPLSFSMEEEKGHVCFKTIDSNEDNRVTYEEFVKYLGDDRERFSSVDQNEDGELTHEEYHESLGHGASEQEQETD